MTESEWRQSVEKTLKYYKEKIKTMKSNNKSRLKKLQTSWQREKRVLKNKLKSLENKNEQLNEENILLCKKLQYLQEEKYDDEEQYDDMKINIHKIFDYCSKSKSKSKNNTFDIQIDNEIANIMNKHKLRLVKWMKNTEILTNEMDKRLLLIKYGYYKQLMAEQQSKMEDISNYISEIISHKRKLKQCVEKNEKEIMEKNKLFAKSEIGYIAMKEKRNLFYNKMLESVDRLNEIIDDENELNEKKCKLYDEYNNSKDQLKQYKNEINHCSFLIKQYQKFDKINDEKINEMRKYFEREWINFKKGWFEWDYKSVICWIKYLIAENQLVLSLHVNLNELETKMKNYKINGRYFEQIDKNQLKLLGFIKLNDRQQIFDKIKELISTYPKNKEINEVEGQIEGKQNKQQRVQIPIQFLCPITKQIMMEPLLCAIDGYNYEKSAIINYLRKYNKSPITNEKCDDDDSGFMLVPNRKLAQKIQTFLYVNPQITVKLDTIQ